MRSSLREHDLHAVRRLLTPALRWLAAMALALGSTTVFAQAKDQYTLGAGFLGNASLETTAVSSQNFFYESSDGVTANGFRVRPAAAVSRGDSVGQLSLNGNLEYSNFDIPGDLDHYFDYSVGGGYRWQPFTRHQLNFSGAFDHGHDSTGLQRTEDVPDFNRGEIDRWDLTTGFLTYRYGAEEALGSNTIRVGQIERKYTTNRRNTVFLDYTARLISYELAYEYSPKTAVIFYASQRATDYARPVISSLGNRNGNELTARVGLRWLASGKTSGELQLGVRDYSVDGRQRPARQSVAWRANVSWVPVPTTQLNLSTGQTSTETFRTDTFYIDERSVEGGWRQTWSPRIVSHVGARYVNSKFVGANRTDNYLAADAGIDYRLARKATVFAQYLSRVRSSNSSLRDYDAPEARLGLRLTL